MDIWFEIAQLPYHLNGGLESNQIIIFHEQHLPFYLLDATLRRVLLSNR